MFFISWYFSTIIYTFLEIPLIFTDPRITSLIFPDFLDFSDLLATMNSFGWFMSVDTKGYLVKLKSYLSCVLNEAESN